MISRMLLSSLLLDISIDLTVIRDNEVRYTKLVTFVLLIVLAITIGAHLWMTGMEWIDAASSLRKIGGGLILALSGLFIIGPLWLGYFVGAQLVELL